MEGFLVKRLDSLDDVYCLVEESKREGFHFLTRLVKEYEEGINTFCRHGECLFGVYTHKGTLIAVGGLNQNPSSEQKKIGRLRRFYVSSNYRGKGVGKLLLTTIIEEAQRQFETVVLYTDTQQADQFYRSNGFQIGSRYPKTTHYLNIETTRRPEA